MNKKIAFLLITFIVGSVIASGHYLIPLENRLTEKDSKIAQIGALVWLRLGSTKNTCEDTYDYFPDGGMRIFYCHIAEIITYDELSRMLNMNVFLRGPHTKDRLAFNSTYEFGHYNPAFVRHIKRIAIPVSKNPYFSNEFQLVYDRYIRDLARISYITYAKLYTNPSLKRRLINEYKKFMSEKKENYYNYYKFYSFMSTREFPETPPKHINTFALRDDQEGGYSGNVVMTAVAFWLRRSMDGTDRLFFDGLVDLLKIYDAEFVRRYRLR